MDIKQLKNYLENMMIDYNNDMGMIYRKSSKDFKTSLKELTSNFDKKTTNIERMYSILNPSIDKTCKNGREKKFTSYVEGYQTFCSQNCDCSKEHNKITQSNIQSNKTQKEKEYTIKMIAETLEEKRSWIPDDPNNFSLEDLKYYLEERKVVCKDRMSNLIKTLPYFIEEMVRKETKDMLPNTKLIDRINSIVD